MSCLLIVGMDRKSWNCMLSILLYFPYENEELHVSVDVLRGLKRSNRSPNHYFYNVWATSWKSFARRMEGLAIWEGLNSILEGGCSHRLRFCSFLKNFLIVSGQQKMKKKKSGFWRSGASLRILTCFFCFYCFYFVFICLYFVFICFYFVFICLYLFLLFLFVFICFYFVVICFYLFSFFLFVFSPNICSGRGRRLFAHVLGNINSLVPWKASQEVES